MIPSEIPIPTTDDFKGQEHCNSVVLLKFCFLVPSLEGLGKQIWLKVKTRPWGLWWVGKIIKIAGGTRCIKLVKFFAQFIQKHQEEFFFINPMCFYDMGK